jgi:hypothetical protein
VPQSFYFSFTLFFCLSIIIGRFKRKHNLLRQWFLRGFYGIFIKFRLNSELKEKEPSCLMGLIQFFKPSNLLLFEKLKGEA